MLPSDLGLPSKFRAFRPEQEEVALAIGASDKRFSLLSAPTGSGKSIMYTAAARSRDARTLILVGTKALQEQLMADFAEVGMVDVRGRGNYTCPEYDTCERPYQLEAVCSAAGKEGAGCPYLKAVGRAAGSGLVVSNYAYWMSLEKYSDGAALGEFDVLVLDEAHAAPDWLTSIATITLEEGEVRSLVGAALPPTGVDLDFWAAWAKQVLATGIIAEELEAANNQRKIRLNSLARDLAAIVEMPADPSVLWTIEETRHGASICPVWAHPFAERYLFRGIPKIILCSATLSPAIGKYLGIEESESDYYEVASSFDPRRRPLIYVPTCRVDRNMSIGDARIWVNRIDRIIEGRLDRKGVIHARSYERAREIAKLSRYADIMVTHPPGAAGSAVECFKRADAPCVLLSPSIEEGVDFPGLECSYQILAKVPFLDGRSPVTAARAKADKGYVNYVAAQTIVQMTGRGMRSADDLCESFILDDHWLWFSKAAIFPKWFKLAWRRSNVVPPAPALSV